MAVLPSSTPFAPSPRDPSITTQEAPAWPPAHPHRTELVVLDLNPAFNEARVEINAAPAPKGEGGALVPRRITQKTPQSIPPGGRPLRTGCSAQPRGEPPHPRGRLQPRSPHPQPLRGARLPPSRGRPRLTGARRDGGRGAAPPHLTSPQRNMAAAPPHRAPLKPAASRPGSPPARPPHGSSGAAMTRLPRLATPPPPRAAILRRERGEGAAAARRHLERGAAMLGVAAGRCPPDGGCGARSPACRARP